MNEYEIDVLNNYAIGNFKISENIEEEKKYTFIELLLTFVKKNNSNLLYYLIIIKNLLEQELLKLINNNIYIYNYIEYLIFEWSLNINPINIINKYYIQYNYDNFIDTTNIYKKYIKTNKLNKDDYLKRLTNEKNILLEDINNLNNNYEYILINLSIINKNEYIDLFKNNSDYDINEKDSNIGNLPENIKYIFLNYIYILNYIKKELHYCITNIDYIIENL